MIFFYFCALHLFIFTFTLLFGTIFFVDELEEYNYQEVNTLANIKSAKKRISVTAKKTMINRMRKSQIKTAIKRFELALAEGNMDAAAESFKYAQKKIQQIASKGTLHKNAAARKVSKLASKLQSAKAN